MGIDFSYDFLVRPEDAGRFLAAVSTICDPEETRSTTVILPEGGEVRVPGTYRFAGDQTVELAKLLATGDLDLSLLFPEDGPLLEYRADSYTPEKAGPVMVGYVYLRFYDGSWLLPGHLNLSFTPATSEQSRLFLRSPSIRETFANLAVTTGTPLCLFDVEAGDRIIVSAGEHRVSTRVPGPLLLWHGGAPGDEAAAELRALLDGHPADPPLWIIEPDRTFVDDLAELSRVEPRHWLAVRPES
ncbi:hypothetical protein [Actinoplanes subglobosus]|uniref:Uncharacterized protein n=1 Tax=Actinoplanes subglobosus TaxID=1547892 RepID=A0ABV8J776_9ACTN